MEAFVNNNKSVMNSQIIYFSHGGGPLPILGDVGHQAMINFMKDLPSRITKPDRILVISAHWEENVPTLIGAPNPPLFYDYYGFPDEAYKLTYPTSGDPDLAGRIADLLTANDIPHSMTADRGLDHGVFIPLKMMYPAANIPVVQLSLIRGLNARQHLALGMTLQDLKKEKILIIGSGFSFHNMQAFFQSPSGTQDTKNEAFQDWLIETCTSDLEPAERENRLALWDEAPFARYCHPREEHLLPLHVCTALAGEPAELIFNDQIMNKRAVAFYWSF